MAKDKERVLMYVGEARHRGKPASYQGRGEAQEPNCDDVTRMYINTRRELVVEIGYTVTEGACYPLQAAAEAAARLAFDKPVMEAYLITAQHIGDELGGLDKEDMHCAMMAELALKRAIVDYVNQRNAQMEEEREKAANG